MTKKIWPALVLVAASLLGSAGAAAQEESVLLATKSAREWIAGVDAAKYEESWDQAAASFKAAITRDKWKEALTAVRTPQGKVLARSLKSAEFTTKLPGAPEGKYVVIQFSTSFENRKDAIETAVEVQESDGAWRLTGYFIK